ncbi:MAG TPA: Rieske (2Fe-2S) protein [Pyrinomonadaceae bacterium]|nr:Rieske (2Fe-2S) protein [Pyrinomonadaceae bacterium]HMP64192.1 Rieske (2Fe-2S) protein [Pyrinomonadaceae bacterium]
MNDELSNAIAKVMSDDGNVRKVTAPHQAEFPYGREDEASVTRREFCNFLFLTSSAFFVASAGFAAKAAYDARIPTDFPRMVIPDAEALSPGSALSFYYPGEHDSAILVRTPEGDYYAFGQKCTHLMCPVYYSKKTGDLECPCHEGAFDSRTGAVLYGPPLRPLDRIEIEVGSDGSVTAFGRYGGGHGG